MTLTPPLKPGDLIDVVAPGSSAPADALQRGVEVLEGWGFRVRIPEGLLKPDTFFANTDAERLKVLKRALHAKDSRAVWFVRGGSGTHRLLPALFKGARPRTPKLILGFSDATSLLNGVLKHWKWSSLHAPVLTQLGRGELAAEDTEELRRLLVGDIAGIEFAKLQPLNTAARARRGVLRGSVIGGNLTVFQNLIGVPEAVSPRGKILFFEEINERGYRIDRTLTHLRQAKFFDGAVAVVFGEFLGGDEPGAPGVNRVAWAIENFARDLKIPLYGGLPVGHGTRNRVVPMGTGATIRAGTLWIDSPLKSPAPAKKARVKERS